MLVYLLSNKANIFIRITIIHLKMSSATDNHICSSLHPVTILWIYGIMASLGILLGPMIIVTQSAI